MIAIICAATGERQFVTSIDGYGDGWMIEGEPLPDDVDAGVVTRLTQADGAWSEDAAIVEADVIARVKAEAERLAADLYTATPAKLISYAAKQAEVLAWHNRGGEEATDPAEIEERYRYAAADAAAHGDAVADAIARFAAGIDAAESRAAAIEATEQAAVARIRAAEQPDEKRAVAAAIDWSAATVILSLT